MAEEPLIQSEAEVRTGQAADAKVVGRKGLVRSLSSAVPPQAIGSKRSVHDVDGACAGVAVNSFKRRSDRQICRQRWEKKAAPQRNTNLSEFILSEVPG